MSKRIDYEQIAAKLDYAALEKKLAQLAERQPPKNRKTAADLLEPLREKLLALQRKGWSSQQLAAELKTAGVPVSAARVREALNRWTNTAKRRGIKRDKAAVSPPAANQYARSKNASGEGQSKFGLA